MVQINIPAVARKGGVEIVTALFPDAGLDPFPYAVKCEALWERNYGQQKNCITRTTNKQRRWEKVVLVQIAIVSHPPPRQVKQVHSVAKSRSQGESNQNSGQGPLQLMSNCLKVSRAGLQGGHQAHPSVHSFCFCWPSEAASASVKSSRFHRSVDSIGIQLQS